MTTTELTDTDRYTIISVDGHAGAALARRTSRTSRRGGTTSSTRGPTRT